MVTPRSKDAFRALAGRAGMCPASALLDLDEQVGGSAESGLSGECSDQPWTLPKQQILECICEGASVGGQSFLEILVRAQWESGVFQVLVDAADSFDPASWDADLNEHFLWVRVRNANQLVRALDLLLRDDNFALVAADLRGLEASEVQSIQPFAWYRLQRLAHQRAGGCVIFSDAPSVRCADRRVKLSSHRRLDDLDQTRDALLARVDGSVRAVNRGQVLRVVGS